MEIEPTTRFIHSSLLLVHQSSSTPEVLEKPKAKIIVLKELYNQLAEIVRIELSGFRGN
ncbi:putative translin [Rosa chinensis]|uniref:Putative translin n=1 Tax=Rosa chinensis TaxID=74649 RepID=A0A2P6QVK2_ROSCH|nr:putative translin [Rosa chinensis]